MNKNSDSSNSKLNSINEKVSNVHIKNQRPKDYLEEREIYEKLCRQNGTKVKIIFWIEIRNYWNALIF